EPVHLIAHSMGGLDARFLISRLNMAERVLTLTTLGTPHRGSTFADWGVSRLAFFLQPFLDLFGISSQAFFDLTTTSCQVFNEQTPDAPGVRYYSVAGQFEASWLTPEWMLSYGILRGAEGANDGLVSVTSASYGEHCDVWDGDHASLINWPNPVRMARGQWRDRVSDYNALVARLAA